MDASIGVSSGTKEVLRENKPDSLSWDAFLVLLRQSVDERKFRRNLDKLLGEMEAESTQAAIERVLAMRTGKVATLRHAEAKERLNALRLAHELAKLSEVILASPTGEETKKAVASLDKQLHAVLA